MMIRLAMLCGVLLVCVNVSHAGVLDGRWRNGYWTDENTGHEDRLRGRFRQTRDGNYRVVFTGTFFKVVPFLFVTKMKVAGHVGDAVILSGESRVPGFGRFSYHAVGDGDNFNAKYDSRRYKGEFVLWR